MGMGESGRDELRALHAALGEACISAEQKCMLEELATPFRLILVIAFVFFRWRIVVLVVGVVAVPDMQEILDSVVTRP